MESIKCSNNKEAVDMLQTAKEFFHIQATREPYNPGMVTAHLSLIDAVQAYLKTNRD